MKPIQIADDIIPLARFKAHASQVLKQLHEQQRPVVITQNGKPAGVLITPEDFDQVQQHRRVVAAIREGLDDVEAGRVINDEDLDAELEAELGL